LKPIFLEKIIFSEQEQALKRVAVTSLIILPKDILLLYCCHNNDARYKQKPRAVAVVIATTDSKTQLSNISITANELKFIPPLVKHE
jgi:hypothetical protein